MADAPVVPAVCSHSEKKKRPATAYHEFIRMNYSAIASKHPEKKFADITKMCGAGWKALQSEDRARFMLAAEKRNKGELPSKCKDHPAPKLPKKKKAEKAQKEDKPKKKAKKQPKVESDEE